MEFCNALRQAVKLVPKLVDLDRHRDLSSLQFSNFGLYRYFTPGRLGPICVKWTKLLQENGPSLQEHGNIIVIRLTICKA